MTVSGSTVAPTNAPSPSASLRARIATVSRQQAQTNMTTTGYYYATFSVSQPTKASLLTAMSTSGEVPLASPQVNAELDDITGSKTGQMLATMTCSGGATSSTVVTTIACPGVAGAAQFTPGHTYLLQFTATEPTLPTTLVNNSGTTPAYFWIMGFSPNTNDTRFYRVTAAGLLVPMELSDLVPPSPNPNNLTNCCADYNIPFPTAESTPFPLPMLRSGRIYVSLSQGMPVQINPPVGTLGPQWAAPSPWSVANDPTFNIQFDWLEINYLPPDGAVGINQTEVQMYGLPIQVILTSGSASITTGGLPGTLSKLFSTIGNAGNFGGNFAGLLEKNASGTVMRVVSPDNGIANKANGLANMPTFSSTYFDAYIAAVWKMYTPGSATYTVPLAMHTSAWGEYDGTVNATTNLFVFTPAQGNTLAPDQQSYSIPVPTTQDAIIGNGNLTNPCSAFQSTDGDICREIGGALSAGINRTTLLVYPVMTRDYTNDTYSYCGRQYYYTTTNAYGTNAYAELIHAASLTTAAAPGPPTSNGGGAAYAFGLDDNCNQSSLNSTTTQPSSMTITIVPF
jgi:hypothetical protein